MWLLLVVALYGLLIVGAHIFSPGQIARSEGSLQAFLWRCRADEVVKLTELVRAHERWQRKNKENGSGCKR
jgi:hypothetical protein